LVAFSPVAVVSVECECDELDANVEDFCIAEEAVGPVAAIKDDNLGL